MPSSSRPLLLVGVISHRSLVNHARRQALRALGCETAAPTVLVRFVMAAGTVDETERRLGDVLEETVASNNRRLGTYLLTNAFFRYAVALSGEHEPHFIARADDDAAFSSIGISTALRQLASFNEDVVWGPLGPPFEWFLWDTAAFMPHCYGYSIGRWQLAVAAYSNATTNTSGPLSLKRSQLECVHPTLRGPFPYAKGPFVAYSRNVARAIVQRLDADEEYVLHNRSAMQLPNLM